MDQTYTVKSDQTNQIINSRILKKFFYNKNICSYGSGFLGKTRMGIDIER